MLRVYPLDLAEFPDQSAELDRGGALGAGHLRAGQVSLLAPTSAHSAVTHDDEVTDHQVIGEGETIGDIDRIKNLKILPKIS